MFPLRPRLPRTTSVVAYCKINILSGSWCFRDTQVFAICAMRSIYTLVSHAISDLPYLKPAVALVLGFVGGKMFAEFFHYEISVGLSLAVVSGPVTRVCSSFRAVVPATRALPMYLPEQPASFCCTAKLLLNTTNQRLSIEQQHYNMRDKTFFSGANRQNKRAFSRSR